MGVHLDPDSARPTATLQRDSHGCKPSPNRSWLRCSTAATLLLAALILPRPGLAAASPSISLVATFDPERQLISGSFEISLRNSSPEALAELQLFLYPEIYRDDPDLDDILLQRVYPGAFDPGGQEVSGLRYQVDAGAWQQPREVRRAAGTIPILVIELAQPVPPDRTIVLAGEFRTRVPRRYGSFGMHAGTVTINGGLGPLLVDRDPSGQWLARAPPPILERHLQLDLPPGWEGTLGGTIVRPLTARGPRSDASPFDRDWDLIARAKSADSLEIRERPKGGLTCIYQQRAGRWITASLRRRATVHNLPLSDGNSVSFVGRARGKRQRRWLRLAVETSRALLANKGIPVGEHGVTLVEAPLRRRLVEAGDGAILISDRFLEATEGLWRYHDIHLAQALLAQEIGSAVAATEDSPLQPFLRDGIAWQLIPEYLAMRWKQHVGARELLSRVDFIPEVDALLSTPLFPFAEHIFDNPRVVDRLRADIRRFNRPLHGGRLLFLALEDRVGALSLRASIDRYLLDLDSAPQRFQQLLEQRTGRNTQALFQQRLGPLPRINLIAEPLQRSRDADGRHHTVVTVRREALAGEASAEEVEVRVRPRLPARGRWSLLRWDGRGKSHSWELSSDRALAVVEVDPLGRHLEIDADGLSLRGDNRRPHKLKVIGSAYLVSLNATSFEVEAYARLELRRQHDHRNRATLYAYTDKETWLGIQTGYVHSFGGIRVGTWRKHRLSVYFGVDLLSERFRPTNAPLLVQASISYTWDSRVWAFAPTRGGRVHVRLFAGKDIELQRDWQRPFRSTAYFGAQVEAIRLFRLHPWHVLALRAKVGWVTGNVIHRNFTLGGNRDLRGLAESTIVDPFRAIGTIEWRHYFFRDGDLQLPLSRMRGLQGVLFAEYGVVGADLQQDAQWWKQHATGRMSVGYGLRVYADWFGLLPGMIGIDLAWTPGSPPGRLPLPAATRYWPEVPVQIYLLAGQSF
jgi:hypothetical protein